MEKVKDNIDSSATIRTTSTLRKKAKIVGRCFVNIVKCFRLVNPCRKRDSSSKNIEHV